MEIGEFCIEPLPKKRKGRARKASLVVFVLTISIVIILCILNKTVVEYQIVEATTYNQTSICYRRKEKVMFPSFFTTFLIFLGVILGTLVERLSLIAEEHHHVNTRYGGSSKMMFKACFRDISWGPVLILQGLTVTVFLSYHLSTGIPVDFMTSFVCILGGIGVGPFIIRILHVNTQSEVHLSSFIEESGTNKIDGLVWYYYFDYLDDALAIFTELISGNSGLSVELSENKLILLLSHDCHVEDNLEKIDRNFKKVDEMKHDHYSFTFPVYRLKVDKNEYRHYAIQFVKEPLQTLKNIKESGIIEDFEEKQFEDEVKLFSRKMFETIRAVFSKTVQNNCVLVPIRIENLKWLNDGGLVRLVVHAIEHTTKQSTGTSKKQDDGFWKFSCQEGNTSSTHQNDKVTSDQLG